MSQSSGDAVYLQQPSPLVSTYLPESARLSAVASRSELASAEWRDFADASDDVIVSLELDGRIRFLNRTACELLGYIAEESPHRHIRSIIEPTDLSAFIAALSRVFAQKGPQLVDTALHRDGTAPLLLHGRLQLHSHNSGAPTAFGVFRVRSSSGDTATPGWRTSLAEQQIIQNVAREKHLTELKSKFISMASHELRTPLAALALGVDFLDKYWTKLPTEQINKNLKTVGATVRQLRSVLDDVLVISRDDEGRLRCNRTTIEIVAFIRKVAEEAATSDQHQHPVEVSSEHSTYETNVDPQLLNHILTNLIGNACKYSAAGASVAVSIDCSAEQVAITVSDCGIGIPVEEQSRLFELFFRASNVGVVAGTGLGLVVVRRCVEAHRGTLSFTSQPGAGTRFTVILPMEGME